MSRPPRASAPLTLSVSTFTRCPDCHAVYTGRHRCLPSTHANGHPVLDQPVPGPADDAAAGVGNASPAAALTYQYRTPDLRRAYMREYMRRRRG